MRWAYLLFDALIFVPTLTLALLPSPRLRIPARPLLLACLAVAAPFVAWDAAVEGRHWFFADGYTLGWRLWGLPVEELLFFVAVPWACVYAWETLLGAATSRPSPRLRLLPWLGWGLAALGATALATGREYTAFALGALALAILLDRTARTALVEQPRFWGFMALVAALGLVFNGFLTRYVVSYDDRFNLRLRITTVPVEDFFYGAALVAAATVVYQRQLRRVY